MKRRYNVKTVENNEIRYVRKWDLTACCMHSRSNRGLALPTSSLFLSESVAGSARTCASRSSARQTLSPFLGFGRRRRRRRLRRRATVKSFRCSPLPLLLHSPPARRTDGRTLHHRSHCISRWRRRKSRGPRTGEVVPLSILDGREHTGASGSATCAFSSPTFTQEVGDRGDRRFGESLTSHLRRHSP